MKKILFIILDGLGDRPIEALDNKTPLEAAETPNMDFLAKNGVCGMQNMLPEGVYPTSEECHLALFGYDYIKDYPGRGVLEALGTSIFLDKTDLAFRVDIGTVDDSLILIDPHAGGVESVKELADSLRGIETEGVKFDIYATLEHRAVLVMRDPKGKISSRVSDTDPHKSGPHTRNVKVLDPKALDDSKEAAFTARILNEYQKKTYEILRSHPFNQRRINEGKLPCNFILTRGIGQLRDTEPFSKKHGLKAAAVAGAPLYKGIARYLGMDLYEDSSFTGTKDTNLEGKITTAIGLLAWENDSKHVFLASERGQNRKDLDLGLDSGQTRMTQEKKIPSVGYNFVYLHIKATDSLAEDFGDFKGKRDFIEKIDKAFAPLLDLKDVIIMITGDHTTSSELSDHTEDPVPFLIYGGEDSGQARMTKEFGESYCKEGDLNIRGLKFIDKVLDSGQARMTQEETNV